MSYWHDPEVPAGYQDADIEMAEWEEAAYEREQSMKVDCGHRDWVADDSGDFGYPPHLVCGECGIVRFDIENRSKLNSGKDI